MGSLLAGGVHCAYWPVWRSRQQLALQNFRRNANHRPGLCHVRRVHHHMCRLSLRQSLPWYVRIKNNKKFAVGLIKIISFKYPVESHRVLQPHRRDPLHHLRRHHPQGLERHERAKLLATQHHPHGSHLRHRSYLHHRRGALLDRLSVQHPLGRPRWASVKRPRQYLCVWIQTAKQMNLFHAKPFISPSRDKAIHQQLQLFLN